MTPDTDERPSTGRAPIVAAIPAYGNTRRRNDDTTGYFDEGGAPRAALASEVVPAEDDALPIWLKLGERIAWYTIGGERFWPLTARHNVLRAYLIGRVRFQWIEDLLGTLLWLPLLAAEAYGLYLWWLNIDMRPLILTEILMICIGYPLVGLFAQFTAIYHLQRVSRIVPFEELLLTRITPEELFYGLIIRPFSMQHAYNVGFCIASGIGYGAVGVTLAYYLINQASFSPVMFLWGPLVAVWLVLRWALFVLAINLAFAFGSRARLFFRENLRAIRQMVGDWLRAGFGFAIFFPMLPWLLVLSLWQLGTCITALILIPVSYVLIQILIGMTKTPTRVMRAVAKHHKYWWVVTREDSEKLPLRVRDVG